MNATTFAVATLTLALASSSARAVNVTVGSGAGCEHSTLQSALDTVRTLPGTHTIRIRSGGYAVPDGMVYSPSVAQTGVFLEGGYAQCTDAAPSGDPTVDAGRAVFNAAGGLAVPALALHINGLVGTFQLRRMAITGGDAFNGSDETLNTGGGLAVRGPASVLLGRGMAIRGNGAGRGGGVALIGGPVNSGSTVAKIDFYLDEGAQITANSAAAQGGGIYCGGAVTSGQPSVLRHANIVLVDGIIGQNVASDGGAFYCFGSVEGGGGFQPRPRAGAAAWIFGNRSTGIGGCAGGRATLDASTPLALDGRRVLGAADGSNGMLAITHNEGQIPALCLSASFTLGSLSKPEGVSRFRLQNLHVLGQRGKGTLGLAIETAEMDLRVQPSGVDTQCEFFAPTPCVAFHDNAYDPDDPSILGNGELISSIGRLQLIRASIRDNIARRALLSAALRPSRIESSLIVDNAVQASAVEPALGRSLFAIANTGALEVIHTTAVFSTELDQFFRFNFADSVASAQASIFASSNALLPANVAGVGSPANFTRRWCGFFQRTSDFASHTQVVDPTRGDFVVLPPTDFGLDPQTFAPGGGLVDWCTTSVITDFHGNEFGAVQIYPEVVSADIGAVETQLPPQIFRDGFE